MVLSGENIDSESIKGYLHIVVVFWLLLRVCAVA